MLESILYTEVQSLSWFARSNFRYLSKDGFALLKRISGVSAKIEQTKDSRKMKSADSVKYQFDQEWTTKLNQPESWSKWIEDNPNSSYQIKQLQDFWEKQKEYAACSNDFLLKSLESIKLSLSHIQKARKEFERYRWRLPEDFDHRYSEFLQKTSSALIEQRQKIVNAMLARLKITSLYSNLACVRRQNVDDVLFYVADHLIVLTSVDKKERNALNTVPPRTNLNENHYIQFYHAIKQYGESDADKHRVDMFHWSKNLGTKATLLSISNFKKPKNKENKDNKVHQKADMPQSGLMLIRTGKDNHTQIIVPSLLKEFIPAKRRTPAWYYWQEHKILDFWEKRQSFLFKLHDLWNGQMDTYDSPSLLTLNAYQHLILTELQNLTDENKNISFLEFDFKKMIKEWTAMLTHLSSLADQQLKKAADQNHQRKFVDSLKYNQPIPVPISKNYPLKKSVISVQKTQHQIIKSTTLQKQSLPKNNAIKQTLIGEQTQTENPKDDVSHQGFFRHW